MSSTTRLSITLSNDLAEIVRGKVESGAYASESEVIEDGLRALQDRDQSLEQWLCEEVLPARQALKADPSRALSSEDVRAHIAAAHEARKRR